MKREQQPLQAKPATSKPMDKLELELDENATHVHRIPKDLINRMREQRATEQREARERAVPESAKAAPAPAPEPARAPASTPHAELAQAFASDDDDDGSMGGVSDDRTAVFRPPPELLARAKRMKPPSKPNPTSEMPTKPPPASLSSDGTDSAQAVPAASRLPAFESVPVKASFSSSVPARSNYAMATALDEPFARSAPAPELAVEMARASATAESQPISSPEIERSAVFAHSEATSGVLSLGLPDATAPESPFADVPMQSEASESALAPMTNEALLNALTASAPEASADTSDEEAPAPTTTSPLVRSERSVPPVETRPAAPRLSLWLAVMLAAAAFVFWRLRHGL